MRIEVNDYAVTHWHFCNAPRNSMTIEVIKMDVPAPVAFSLLNPGDVALGDSGNFIIKCDATTACNLATGAISTGIPGNQPFTPMAGARLLV